MQSVQSSGIVDSVHAMNPCYQTTELCPKVDGAGVRLQNARALTWTQIDYGTGEIRFRIKSEKPGQAAQGRTLPVLKERLEARLEYGA